MTFFFQNLWRRNIEISPILIIINIIIIIVMAKEFSEYFHLALKLIFYFSCNKLMLVILNTSLPFLLIQLPWLLFLPPFLPLILLGYQIVELLIMSLMTSPLFLFMPPYNGTKELIITDGTSLQITHIDSMSLTLSNFTVIYLTQHTFLKFPTIFYHYLVYVFIIIFKFLSLLLILLSRTSPPIILYSRVKLIKEYKHAPYSHQQFIRPSLSNVPHLLGIIVLAIHLQKYLI